MKGRLLQSVILIFFKSTGYVAVVEENECQQPLCGMHWRLAGMKERML